MANCFVREGLDLFSTLADNVYLFSRMRLIPLGWKATRRADKLADSAILISTALGLVQVAQARREVWSEGRAVRKGVMRFEERVEKAIEAELRSETEEEELERREEEKRLRERARGERRRLRRLRGELNELWWERLRLTAEALFAGTCCCDSGSWGGELTRLLQDTTFSRSRLARRLCGVGQEWSRRGLCEWNFVRAPLLEAHRPPLLQIFAGVVRVRAPLG